jgi:hypothetical protein
MVVDLTKPVETRSGHKVRILCTDGPAERPIAAIVYEEVERESDRGAFAHLFSLDGSFYDDREPSMYDLVTPPVSRSYVADHSGIRDLDRPVDHDIRKHAYACAALTGLLSLGVHSNDPQKMAEKVKAMADAVFNEMEKMP